LLHKSLLLSHPIREEQHDDQVLHELLRCFKALSTSSIGCFALRSSCPTPFVQLVSLLYSDKKPGEIATRQLIVELLLLLFDLYPPSSLPATSNKPGSLLSGQSRQREAWESESTLVASNLITLPPPHKTFFSLIRALLLTPAPPPTESPGAPISPHAFIESLHTPRIYKTYLQELSDVCRDYFWVFCHPNNTIWVLSETNEGSVEKPRAPGGMTGGVEYEAISYFVSLLLVSSFLITHVSSQTTQLKLVNAISKCVEPLNMPKDHEYSAYRFHMDLFLSGFERIILVSAVYTTSCAHVQFKICFCRSHVKRQQHTTQISTSSLHGTSPPPLEQGMNCLTQWRASSGCLLLDMRRTLMPQWQLMEDQAGIHLVNSPEHPRSVQLALVRLHCHPR